MNHEKLRVFNKKIVLVVFLLKLAIVKKHVQQNVIYYKLKNPLESNIFADVCDVINRKLMTFDRFKMEAFH